MSRSHATRRFARWLVAVGLASAISGCATGPGSGSPSATPLTTPVAPTTGPEAPPDAMLAAEGGDPVVAQVGTNTWGDTGSDSPWLPGAPIRVGTGEPLAVTLVGEAAIESWTAIYVPFTADGPAGGQTLGTGTGTPTFTAPGAGRWTVDLEVVFADDLGTVHYAWRLDVE